jgi:YfiH family protein
MQLLAENSGIVCTFSNRHHGNMSLFYGDTATSLDNRKKFLTGLGIDWLNLVCAKQVHGAHVDCIEEKDKGRGALKDTNSIPDTDAFITDKKNIPLAIFTADCLSVFLYEPQKEVAGLVHAGWRSTQEKILFETIKLMQEKFNIETKYLIAGFGPGIRECCYEVNLLNLNKEQLFSLGVSEANIFDSQICTACQNKEYFSYRKEGSSCGRMMSVIMLKNVK